MNGYAYSNNSPISRSDPSGLMIDGAGDCGAIGTCNVGSKPEHIKNNPDGKLRNGSTGSTGTTQGNDSSCVCGLVGTPIGGDPFVNPNFSDEELKNWTNTAPALDPVAKEVAIAACGWVPFLGAGCDLYDLKRSWNEGDAVGVVTGVIGFLPLGDVVKAPKQVDNILDAMKAAKNACKCFLAGTDVLLADGTTEDIEDIELGDEVQATDPETGESGSRKVTRLIVTESDKKFNELSIATEDGIEKLTATHEHPFWVPELGQWVAAHDLANGMHLRKPDGSTVTVTANRPFSKHARTYNLTVDDLHTYYVLAGQTPVLVHNSGGCIPWSSGSVSRASKSLTDGATSVTVKSRSEAEELFLRTYQGAGYRNASGMDGVGTKQYYGTKRGTYHWDDQLGEDGRVLGHGAGNRDGDLPHLQVHTFDGPIVRIFWGG
ncbi:hypothetical protein G3I71_11835 [Streptomyces sp. SID12501]|uniref:Hint domain-containing protein n=2 Tax=Streptomyces sp. SID12501 TaxID=2706042 RepID=A0A6B3BQ98_9ACTN|nr:hypothetical protein [Streptomyces sp. SID12501]